MVAGVDDRFVTKYIDLIKPFLCLPSATADVILGACFQFIE